MLKKIGMFYKRNRVYSILMIISIMCILSILIGVILYFIGQTNNDKYGNRLSGIESVKIQDNKINDIKNKIKENELVDNVEVDIRGKLIYIIINLKTGKHSDSEAIAQASLEMFGDEEKAFYDIQYIVSSSDKKTTENFPIMGYIKAGNSVIKWTNYYTITEKVTGEINEE